MLRFPEVSNWGLLPIHPVIGADPSQSHQLKITGRVMPERTDRGEAPKPDGREMHQHNIGGGRGGPSEPDHIERLRERLLDLSDQNPLLNFLKDGGASPQRQLGFVEVNLERVLTKLRGGEELGFRAVPDPESDSNQMISFDEFTNNPETYLDGEEKREMVIGTVSPPGLRGGRGWQAEEYARHLGINTSYELESGEPKNGELKNGASSALMVERGVSGNELQVLYYADDLDQILRGIEVTSRTVEQETGVASLCLVLGFLEWYEPAGSEVPRLAPLLIVPIVLLKRGAGGRGQGSPYIVEWSGEEIEVNPTLRVMIGKRFGSALPELRADEGFGAYLSRLASLMVANPRWQVRHRLTLTSLDLHRRWMWEDLDPANWPGNRLTGHSLVRNLFTRHSADGASLAVPPVNNLEEVGELPPLVCDADSSQLMAVVTALRGESLIIEGPPGTGKSQTIANLIAAALWQGRSVLLVAERMKALEGVRQQLAEVGLGDFCFALGRQGGGDDPVGGDDQGFVAQTRELAASLRQRLERRGTVEIPATLGQKRAIRRDYLRRLGEYDSIIGLHYGACGRTIGETIGIRETILQTLLRSTGASETIAQIEAERIERAEGLTLSQVEALEENAEICEQSLLKLLRGTPFHSHPWHGLRRESLDADEEQLILDVLRELVEVTEAIGDALRRFAVGRNPALAGYEQSVSRLISLEPLLPSPNRTMRRNLLPLLTTPEARADFRTFVEWLAERDNLRRSLSRHFRILPELDSDDLDRLRAACRRMAELGVERMTMDELRQKSEWMLKLSDYLTHSAGIFDQVVRLLECELTYDLTTVRTVVRALILLNELPLTALANRVPGLERDGLGPVLTRARQEAEQVRKLARTLSVRIDQRLTPPLERLVRYASVSANAGLFSFVSRDFREARREWLGILKQDEIRSPRQMARDFRDLLGYQNQLLEFTRRSEYAQILGSIFKGLETPFTDYDQLIKWYDRVRLILGQASDPARKVARSLFTVPTASLKSLLQFKDVEAREQIEDFVSFFGRFEEMESNIPAVIRQKDTGDLKLLADRLRDTAEVCQSVGETFADLRVETDSPLSAVAESLAGLKRLNELREMISSRQDLAAQIDAERIGTESEFTGVEAAIDFVEQLESSGLPTDYQVWLCDPDLDQRLSLMRETISRLRGLYLRYQVTRERFHAVTGIDEEDWYRVDTRSAEVSISDVGNRARRALDARDELPLWLLAGRARQLMIRQGLSGLADLLTAGKIPTGSLVDVVRFIYHNSVLAGAVRQFPRLSELSGLVLDETRRRLAAVDREVCELNREEIAARLDNQHLPPGNRLGSIDSYTELGLISHLVANQNTRIGIREVIRRSAGALVALKPCFIMTPHSVARYLPPESIRFDLVIIDEASQLRPEEVLGVIARGGQMIVVGDRLQLPPPSRLNSIIPADESCANGRTDAESGAGLTDPDDLESILDLAAQRNYPVCQLRWHYRSRHESLISFSNHEFYQDRLLTLPAPQSTSRGAGVRLHYVQNGVCSEMANLNEAKMVVEATIDHLLNRQEESLGIVGIGRRQQELIQKLLEEALRDNPTAAKRYYQLRDRGEPVFVHTLDGISRDERDAIFISGSIGRNPQGVFRLSMCGPLNNPVYGHRWLNVMITRARQRMVCFSSVRSGEIQPGPKSARGVWLWRAFLAFLETGRLPRTSSGEPRQGQVSRLVLSVAVATALRERGLIVLPSIEGGDGLIDLVIAHPNEPDRALLGIECETEPGRYLGSIGDRYRLKPTILAGRGWALHRVWAHEWSRAREYEISRIVDRVEELFSCSNGSAPRL